jgi:hypothetical protein
MMALVLAAISFTFWLVIRGVPGEKWAPLDYLAESTSSSGLALCKKTLVPYI